MGESARRDQVRPHGRQHNTETDDRGEAKSSHQGCPRTQRCVGPPNSDEGTTELTVNQVFGDDQRRC
jgi:hypothetical protein